MKKQLYILDVSGFIFRAYFALPPMTNEKGESTNALFGFIRSVIKLFKDFGPDNVVAVFDGPDNKKQRKEIYDKYKENRVRAVEDLPSQMEKAKVFCDLLGIPVVEIGGVEADDAMGSIAKWAVDLGWTVFLCTGDKDLAQLVNDKTFLLNPWKDNLIADSKKVEEIYGVPPHQIVDLLAMMGDASDNIPGVKGVGPKTAQELLKQYGSLEAILSNIDNLTGKKKELFTLQKENALLSQKLATIYTDVKFDHDPSIFQRKETDFAALKMFYLEMDFKTLLKEMDEFFTETPIVENKFYFLVDTEEDLDALIQKLKSSEEIAIDTEATSLNFREADLVGIGFCMKEGEAYYVPLNGKLGANKVIETLKPVLADPKRLFFGHNLKYDFHILLNAGLEVNSYNFDTILASYILKTSSRRHSLDELALQYFGKVKIPIKALIGSGKKEITMAEVPIEKVSDYCCEDVDYTFRLKQIFAKELQKHKDLSDLFYNLELPLIRILTKMERSGIFLDIKYLEEMSRTLSKEIEHLEKEIYSLAGETFNISSPKQLSQILFEKMGIKPVKKTATGLSTNAEVLEVLALEHPIALKILEYRSIEKLRSTYIDPLPMNVHAVTRRIHPTFTQWGTTTGRLSCQNPNLQNIPIKTPLGRKIRTAFHPQRHGWSYLAADYSQIELRLLAHMSDDPHLIKAFKQGEDIHAFTASLVFDIPLNEVTQKMRNQAKAINFGIIYGQQAFGLSQELKIDIHKAASFIEAYFLRYPSVMDYIKHSIEMVRKTGRAKTMFGREREIPEIHSQNSIVRSAAERLAVNTPLQGSAADLIKMAMLEIDSLLTRHKMESFMILSIHDELIFEAPEHEIKELTALVKGSMEKIFSLKVPLIVDVAVGKNWGEC